MRAQIAVKLFGSDLDVLRSQAAAIQGAMQTVPGVVDLQTEKQVLVPQVRIRPDRDALARYGLRVGDLTHTLETALAGRAVSSAIEGQRSFDIVVRYDDAARNSVEAIHGALIDTPSGLQVPLGPPSGRGQGSRRALGTQIRAIHRRRRGPADGRLGPHLGARRHHHRVRRREALRDPEQGNPLQVREVGEQALLRRITRQLTGRGRPKSRDP